MLFLNNWVFILVAICCPVIPVLCVWCDVVILGAVLNECSVTEIVQEILLTVIVIIHMLLIIKYNEVRQCNILIAGFFSAMLFRELDAVFDLIGHGSWIYYSMTVSFLSLSYAIYNWRKTLAQLFSYMCTPHYGIMLSGILCTLVFSRLFGMSVLWESLLKDNYLRTVKNIVEEGQRHLAIVSVYYLLLCVFFTWLDRLEDRLSEKLCIPDICYHLTYYRFVG